MREIFFPTVGKVFPTLGNNLSLTGKQPFPRWEIDEKN
jgi:hypothetical protein